MKDNIFKLKRRVRLRLPETNSSSSHSLVISPNTDQLMTRDEILNELSTYMDSSGNLFIDSKEFGRELARYDDVYSRIQYAASLIVMGCEEEELLAKHKDLALLGYNIKKFLGLKNNVTFNLESSYLFSVDHQSYDKYLEVFESERSLINFLFGKTSRIYTSDDGGVDDLKFYELNNFPNINEAENYGYIRVDLPENSVGAIEFPLDNPFCPDIDGELYNFSVGYSYSEVLKKVYILPDGRSVTRKDIPTDTSNNEVFFRNGDAVYIDGYWYLPWVSSLHYTLSPEGTILPWSSHSVRDDNLWKDINQKNGRVKLIPVHVFISEYDMWIV